MNIIFEGSARALTSGLGVYAGWSLARNGDRLKGALLGGLLGYLLPVLLFGPRGAGPGAGGGGGAGWTTAEQDLLSPVEPYRFEGGSQEGHPFFPWMGSEGPVSAGTPRPWADEEPPRQADELYIEMGYDPVCDPNSPLYDPSACG